VKRSGRDEPIGVAIHMHGNNTRTPVQLSSSQTSKNAVFLVLLYVFYSTNLGNTNAEQIKSIEEKLENFLHTYSEQIEKTIPFTIASKKSDT
jgi:hypothetical protein